MNIGQIQATGIAPICYNKMEFMISVWCQMER